jgi:hypothetical protein
MSMEACRPPVKDDQLRAVVGDVTELGVAGAFTMRASGPDLRYRNRGQREVARESMALAASDESAGFTSVTEL